MNEGLLVLGIAAVVIGLAGIVLPLLPGVPLVFGGLWLLAWLDGYTKVGVATVVVLGILAALSVVLEYVASILGVQKAGASRYAVVGAALGVFFGFMAGPVGIVVGPILGAVGGELLARRTGSEATRAGVAAGIGFLVALLAKLGIALVMLGIFAAAWFW